MKKYRLLVLLLWISQTLNAAAQTKFFEAHTDEQFRKYWYSQGAEISRFELKQARYGEIHDGDVLLVFVTESMNPELQVKADQVNERSIPVLKLNAMREFHTGIYAYSTMASVFAPIDTTQFPLPLKITTTVQEWCGHVFLQMNLQENQYRVQSRSYFEAESDQDLAIDSSISEDAIWTLIRIAPEELPTGEFQMIPGTLYSRLMHKPLNPLLAVGSFSTSSGLRPDGSDLIRYEIHVPAIDRILTIIFERKFPYRIHEWADSYPSLAGKGGKKLTTTAKRTHIVFSDYWKRNKKKDRRLRRKLGLRK